MACRYYLCRHQTVIRRILHTIFSLWLATLLLFGVTPKEAMHACSGHQDTVHRHDTHGPSLETAHHHCSFLGFQLMPFAAPPVLRVPVPHSAPEYVSFPAVQDVRAALQRIEMREGRGPPALA
jgi:hypothetical protein